MTKIEKVKLSESLMEVCMNYSNFKNKKRRESFGKSMFERLNTNIKYNELYENCIVYKGAQWGGKWGNFYRAVFFRNGEFHYGCGFSNKQILS